ncbi:hypothetical protein CU098_006405 [Rhizopus stolonifer]|uniref:Endonuclease/exonuclease/phosphatase domain-containing protein n=1 Tax=Rhizopus stolonifer TaxID=4846 RepID=A0A367JDS5_RHIST|nr:hypothetical protein CU098_006405 [Rhizopus stolonifer]
MVHHPTVISGLARNDSQLRATKNVKSSSMKDDDSADEMSQDEESDEEGMDYISSEGHDSDSEVEEHKMDAVKANAMTALTELLSVQMGQKMALIQQIHTLQQRYTEESLNEFNQNTLSKLRNQLMHLLVKSNNRQTQKHYIRHLRLQKLDIICFQETNTDTQPRIDALDILFQPSQSFWTPYWALLEQSFTNAMTINNLENNPTLQKQSRDVFIYSTIDYVFAGADMRQRLTHTNITTLPAIWSDCYLLQSDFVLSMSKSGPGMW